VRTGRAEVAGCRTRDRRHTAPMRASPSLSSSRVSQVFLSSLVATLFVVATQTGCSSGGGGSTASGG